ncbi:MAG: hypothetical protein IT287_07950, partial [Bdellovibrionaceae bacterium]|nr:hypothetical protein [Pseudobdellovibrionaceae bacterium]
MSTFCILPFIKLSNKHTGEYRVCCNQYQEPILDQSKQPMRLSTHRIDAVWNSQYLKNLRQQFLIGEKPEACSKCWSEEKHGGFSMRQYENSRYLQKYSSRIEAAKSSDG